MSATKRHARDRDAAHPRVAAAVGVGRAAAATSRPAAALRALARAISGCHAAGQPRDVNPELAIEGPAENRERIGTQQRVAAFRDGDGNAVDGQGNGSSVALVAVRPQPDFGGGTTATVGGCSCRSATAARKAGYSASETAAGCGKWGSDLPTPSALPRRARRRSAAARRDLTAAIRCSCAAIQQREMRAGRRSGDSSDPDRFILARARGDEAGDVKSEL